MSDLIIRSPLTGSNHVVVEEEIDSQIIKNLYLQEYNIDVSDYFKEVESVKICRCLDTDYRFYYPLTLAGKDELYRELQKIEGYYSSGKWEHQVAINFIPADCLVLEVGCGNGKFLEILEQKGINYIGLELNDDAVRDAQKIGLCVQNQTIQEHAKINADKYDIVCLFQVLEHIVEVESFLKACIAVLKPGGKLIIGVPHNNPYLLKHDKYFTLNLPPHHMGLWNAKSLANLEKFFPIRLDRYLIQILEPWYYDNYFGFYIQSLKSKSVLLGNMLQFIFRVTKFFLFRIRPAIVQRNLQNLFGSFFEGHTVLSVFTKVSG
ncbi:class I SAM-dependent methyltransferase [Scytonema sp. UIC 10036]|uniref:class I SAM-dependent methyltransferase n=1 Tax=Scytonema sp. UIC 10036 TaxID=2304196 RepID=UPI00140FC005|nr:class I SAM-dependent methyltransferase [Scytonema sp. UIC 10036]